MTDTPAPSPASGPPPSSSALRRSVPLVALVVGGLAILPPYVGPKLLTLQKNEVADHVLPGIVIIALCVAVLFSRGAERGGLAMLVIGLIVVLAGIWMVSTHVALVAQMLRNEAPKAATVWHTTMGVLVLAVGLVWVAAYWSEGAAS